MSNKNWIPIPNGNWMPTINSPFEYDYNVYYQTSPSIKFAKGILTRSNLTEANNRWMPKADPEWIFAGDRIVMRGWCKCNPINYTLKYPMWNGAIIGFDLYGDERLWEIHPEVVQSEIWKYARYLNVEPKRNDNPIYVPFGTDWTQLSIDITMPDKVFEYNDYHGTLQYGPQRAIGFIPWLTTSWRDQGQQVTNIPNPADCWFSDMELYINPEAPPPPGPTTCMLNVDANIQVQLVVKGVTVTTPYIKEYPIGTLMPVVVPQKITVGETVYNFMEWSDGSTVNSLLFLLKADTVLYATYEAEAPSPAPNVAPILVIAILAAAASQRK